MDPLGGGPQVGEALRSSVDLVLAFGSDFVAFLALTAVAAVFAFYFGRDRLTALIAGILAAVPLYTYFPFVSMLGANPWLHIGLYLAFVIVGLVAFMGLSNWVPSTGVGFVKTLGLAAIAGGLLLAVALNLLPIADIYTVSEPTRALFSAQYLFWWIAAGLGGVLLLGR